jgi:hypothetical protein
MPKHKTGQSGPPTPQERDFVNNIVLNGMGQAKAAIAAGYPERSAGPVACELLGRPRVREYMRELKAGQDAMIRAQTGEKTEEIIQDLLEESIANRADAFNPDGTVRPIDEWPEALQKSLTSIDIKELWGKDEFGDKVQVGRIVKIRFDSKRQAQDMAMKVLGTYAPVQHQHMHATLSDILEASAEMDALPPAQKKAVEEAEVVDAEFEDAQDSDAEAPVEP